MESKVSKYQINYHISDLNLENQYMNRDKLGFFKKMYIEHKYNKALEKELKDNFEKAKRKY